MNFDILMRDCDKKRFLDKSIKFFIEELNLTKSKWHLFVSQSPAMREDGTLAVMSQVGHGLLVMILDNRAPYDRLLTSVAHEMVHAKQLASGRLKSKIGKNSTTHIWHGKKISNKIHYFDTPWEKQAYREQHILVNKFIRHID